MVLKVEVLLDVQHDSEAPEGECSQFPQNRPGEAFWVKQMVLLPENRLQMLR